MSSTRHSPQESGRESNPSTVVLEVLGYLNERTAAGDSRFTASGVSRALDLPAHEVRAVLAEFASESSRIRLLEAWIEYECPDHSSIVLTLREGEAPNSEWVVCPTNGEDVHLPECNRFVTYRPTEQFQEHAREYAPGPKADPKALYQQLAEKTA